MRRGAANLLAPLLAAVVWSGCASRTPSSSPAPENQGARQGASVDHVRRLLDTGMLHQATGHYAQSQHALSNALSELSLMDTAGATSETRDLARQVLGAMRNNLPYSLEPDIIEDPDLDEEDGVAILDSLLPDTAAMAPLDSASEAALRREVMADSTQSFDLPVEINDLVLMNLRIFKDRVPQHFARWLERKGRWEPYIVQELQARGMPKDLLYLAMIESGFNPRATSPAAAAGIWQFIPGTGRRFGLRIDRFVDERRDPRKATQAAIAYLSILYQQFGDWRLAMAAYNCGENCVDRAVRRAGHTDYWSIPLPKETRNYVPRIFAAAILSKNPKAHGFMVEPWAPVVFDTCTVEGGITFAQVSQALGVSEDSLGLLNPALIRGTTPPAHAEYLLNLPAGTRDRFLGVYASLERSYQAPVAQKYVHRVRQKETLAGIAARYGVSVGDIKRWNKIGGRKVRAGRSLVIWGDYPGGTGKSLAEPPLAKRGNGIPEASHQISHKLRRGETLVAIARRYGVTAQDIKDWNGLSGKPLKAGRRIWVSAPTDAEKEAVSKIAQVPRSTSSSATARESSDADDSRPVTADAAVRHRVRKGETLAAIARRYGVTAQDIKDWNGLSGKPLKAGRKILVSAPADAEKPVADNAAHASRGAHPAARAQESDADDSRPVTADAAVRHRVRKGETLAAIARRYGVTAQDIKDWNGLSGKPLKAGRKILVSAPADAEKPVADNAAHASRGAHPAARAQESDADDSRPDVAESGVSHRVRKGETLASIALRYGTTVESIRERNSLTSDRIRPGARLWVGGKEQPVAVAKPAQKVAQPRAPSPPSAPVASAEEAQGATRVHVVHDGESLDAIAHQYSVAVSSLRILNRLTSSRIVPGQKLMIPGGAPAQAAPRTVVQSTPASKVRTVSYKVRPGDSLYSIARAQATTVDSLIRLNGLKGGLIKPGQVILVPLASAR